MANLTIWQKPAGSCERFFLPVYGGGAELPVTILTGAQPGPKVVVSAGVHCAEYVGIQAVNELSAELLPKKLCGTLVLLHLMNPTGFANRTMSMVYEDGKNLNRVFPGDSEGTLADRIAYTVSQTLLAEADAYIDLHSGDGYEELTPYVYYQAAEEPDIMARSRAMAAHVDVPYMVPSRVNSGEAYHGAALFGVPAILIERGGLGVWRQREVNACKKDVRNVLRFLGLLDGKPEERRHTPAQEFAEAVYAKAEHTGCWYPRKKVGESIAAGELLGEVRDCFGSLLQSCHAMSDGVLLYQVRSLNVLQDGTLLAYGLIAPRT